MSHRSLAASTPGAGRAYTLTRPDTWVCMYFYRHTPEMHTHALAQILTSRSVNAECRQEMRTDNVVNRLTTPLSPRVERFVAGQLSPRYQAAHFFCHFSYLISSTSEPPPPITIVYKEVLVGTQTGQHSRTRSKFVLFLTVLIRCCRLLVPLVSVSELPVNELSVARTLAVQPPRS